MSAVWIEAESDSAALKDARQSVNGARFELWSRNRLVERSHPEEQ